MQNPSQHGADVQLIFAQGREAKEGPGCKVREKSQIVLWKGDNFMIVQRIPPGQRLDFSRAVSYAEVADESGTGIVGRLNENYFQFLLDKNSGASSLSLTNMPELGHHCVNKIKPEITLSGREVSLKAIWHASLVVGQEIVSDFPEVSDYRKLREDYRAIGDLGTDEDRELGDYLERFGFNMLGTHKRHTFYYSDEARKGLTSLAEDLGETRTTVAVINLYAAWSQEDCLAKETKRDCLDIVNRFRSRIRFRLGMGRGGLEILRKAK